MSLTHDLWRPLAAILGLIALLWAVAILAGCTQRYRVVRGPAQLTIAGTAYSPGISVTLEEGASVYFAPHRPSAEVLAHLIDADEQAPAADKDTDAPTSGQPP